MAVSDADKATALTRALRRSAKLTALQVSDSDLVDDIVDDCALLINTEVWKTKTIAALTLLICHFGVRTSDAMTSGSGAAAGPVASKSFDKMSVSYAVPTLSDGDAEWSATPFGLQYLALRRSIFIVPITGRT